MTVAELLDFLKTVPIGTELHASYDTGCAEGVIRSCQYVETYDTMREDGREVRVPAVVFEID